ncbi:hypothetical protein [Reichenbachiella sp.]|uniref:hypothetical protein n=1 Tax=Reichenbachiella sp. TaxID=2184521 RepID=UPI003BB14179
MSITLADQYYLKALDDYDYSFTEVLENLNYALSYDTEHAGANYLMGKLYMEQFQKFDLAEEHFVAAMSTDPENINTCENFAWLMVKTRRYKEALKLINYALDLKGALLPELLRLKALTFELTKEYDKAKNVLNEAIAESYDSRYIDFLEDEKNRVNRKQEMNQKVSYHVS